ncbi:MAG TPA: class I SAM-dependent methyltransferase [Candidatus Acidoferrales bacterium]|nr:class I SAM-dependent methyltransferase [Candidatus Acidoferrales bacterium]
MVVLRRPQLRRDTTAVVDEYESGWAAYRTYLESTATLDEWLRIRDIEDVPDYYYVDGRVSFEAFNSGAFYRQCLLDALRTHFPGARSVTEFGCGVGRNLLFLHRETGADCYGYELNWSGVEVARAAAEKFGINVEYAQLDYVNDLSEKYVFPESDVAFTMFSLEQLPRSNARAVRNIFDHVRLGTIHIEPVPENYPWSLRGILGRIDHRKVDYLANFDRTVKALGVKGIHVERLASAHNPLMSPSVYVLRKS